MAVNLGNLALLLHISSPQRKPILTLPLKRDSSSSTTTTTTTSCCSCSYGYEVVARGRMVVARGKSNSEQNGVDFDAESSDEEVDGNGNDFEMRIRRRVKDFEERRELEKKAEEYLQSRVDDGVEESEEDKRMRVRKELEKVAKEQAERRATAQLMFDLGQKAYGRGMYGRSIEFLEGALTIIPRSTLFGGEIQIWLAMAYEAYGRHDDCIDLYKELEKSHSSISIRRQAAELRYILEAPKLKITQEEMVTIPLIGSSYDRSFDCSILFVD
ncbi:binding protein [Trifolium pratense]|uniref:Binding protein n=1 Tax=Trifolium pratense TaxID=57577 RepID=A0A2K3NG27_TRIPR|nr:binding protein [Trifolium pratense]